MEQSESRLKVLSKIDIFERMGAFNLDVEDDLPAKPIFPKDVDYTGKKMTSKVLTRLANTMGAMFFENMIRHKKLIIKDVLGLENLEDIGAAIVTCNHFNIADNYVVFKAMKPKLRRRQKLYKVIKDSNYTNFKGPVRLMMRHANTLPVSSNTDTMKEFYKSISILLERGEKILIYPEKSMWWNYKKPRPILSGAFKLAVKNNVPILPVFVTMTDSQNLDKDGFWVQEYVVHFLKPIFADKTLARMAQIEKMKQENYEMWVQTYESAYGQKLVYSTK